MFEFITTLMPAVAIFIFSLIVVLIINLCYKFLINQNKIKLLKKRIKDLNKKVKKDKENVQKYLTEIIQLNNKLMAMTIKPMFISMILILLILPGLSSFYGNIKFKESVNIEGYQIVKENNIIKINNKSCTLPCRIKIGNFHWNIYENELERVSAFSPIMLPIIGDDFGWFSWYILCTFMLMLITKKLMGIEI